MKDAIVIAIVIGFFALCAAYVTWCERVLAADAPDRLAHRGTAESTSVGRAASTAGAADTSHDTPGHDASRPDAAALVVGGGRDARRR